MAADVILFPTTTVDVYRGDGEENEWGDATDNETTPAHTNVPAAVVEDSQLRFGPADLRAELVEQFTIRLPQPYGITEGDRLRDARTSDWYLVTGVSSPQSLVGSTSTRLITKRVRRGQ